MGLFDLFNKNDYESIKKQELKEQSKEGKKMQKPKKPELEKEAAIAAISEVVVDEKNNEIILKNNALEIKCSVNKELFNEVRQLIFNYTK